MCTTFEKGNTDGWQKSKINISIIFYIRQESVYRNVPCLTAVEYLVFLVPLCLSCIFFTDDNHSMESRSWCWSAGSTSRTNQHPECFKRTPGFPSPFVIYLQLKHPLNSTDTRHCLPSSQCCSCLAPNLRWSISIYSRWMNVLSTVFYIMSRKYR